MKLIGCPFCNDLVALTQWKKSCKCGKVYGKYLPDGLHARISPMALPLAAMTDKILWLKGDICGKVDFEISTTAHDGTDIEVCEFEE